MKPSTLPLGWKIKRRDFQMLLLRCEVAEQDGLIPGEGATHRIVPDTLTLLLPISPRCFLFALKLASSTNPWMASYQSVASSYLPKKSLPTKNILLVSLTDLLNLWRKNHFPPYVPRPEVSANRPWWSNKVLKIWSGTWSLARSLWLLSHYAAIQGTQISGADTRFTGLRANRFVSLCSSLLWPLTSLRQCISAGIIWFCELHVQWHVYQLFVGELFFLASFLIELL